MSSTINYSASPCPNFDAVEDIKKWLGNNWDSISKEMSEIGPDQKSFTLFASFAGVRGFPVKAWYELYHGQNSWED